LAAAGLAALVFSSHAAFALSQCAMNAPNGVLAEAGQTCNVSGTYATSANNQILGQATGLGALITGPGEEGTISFTTSGSFSNALQADTGGAITLTPTADNPGTVTTTGNNSIGLYATGSASGEGGTVASSITVQNLNITTQGNFANGVQADTGGVVTLNGGSVAVTGTDAFVAGSTSGGTLNLSGTTITATGAGSGGLYANGTGSTVTGTGLTITTHGNYDSENNFGAAGISNQSYGERRRRRDLDEFVDPHDGDAGDGRLHRERRNHEADGRLDHDFGREFQWRPIGCGRDDDADQFDDHDGWR